MPGQVGRAGPATVITQEIVEDLTITKLILPPSTLYIQCYGTGVIGGLADTGQYSTAFSLHVTQYLGHNWEFRYENYYLQSSDFITRVLPCRT